MDGDGPARPKAQEPSHWEWKKKTSTQKTSHTQTQTPASTNVMFGSAAGAESGGGFRSGSGGAGGKSGVSGGRGRLKKLSAVGSVGGDANVGFQNPDVDDAHETLEFPFDLDKHYPVTLNDINAGLGDDVDTNELAPKDLVKYEDPESAIADELGLLNVDDYPTFEMSNVIFQLPSKFPTRVPGMTSDVSTPRSSRRLSGDRTVIPSLSELPPGKIGKLLVFASGNLKLKIGEVLYDVRPGSTCHAPQRLYAVGAAAADGAAPAAVLSDIDRRLIVTPDMEQLISDSPIPDYEYLNPAVDGGGGGGVKKEPVDDMMQIDASDVVTVE